MFLAPLTHVPQGKQKSVRHSGDEEGGCMSTMLLATQGEGGDVNDNDHDNKMAEHISKDLNGWSPKGTI